MKSDLVRIVLMSLVTLVATSAQAQQLWDRARDGMTVAEVRKAFPKAKDNPKASMPNQQRVDGAKWMLELPDVKIAGLTFIASFAFLNDELDQVNLNAEGSTKQIKDAHTRLVNSFRAKYGAPVEENNFSTKYHSNVSEKWMSNSTQISILTINNNAVPGIDQLGIGSIDINYRIGPMGSRRNRKK